MNASDKLPRSGYIKTIYEYLLGLIKKLDTNTQSLRSRMNALTALAGSGGVPAGTIEAEVTDARVDPSGQVYANLGEAVRGQVNGLKSTLNNLFANIAYTENTGYYFNENGSLEADSNTTACVYTDKITVCGGQTVKWTLGTYTHKHYLWGAYMEYNSKNEVIGSRKVFCNTSPEEAKTASGEFTISENASKIAFCWRSYGQSNMLTGIIFYDNNFISDVGTELRDIRIGYDGTEYETAGDAVRGQIEDIYNFFITSSEISEVLTG